MNSFLMTWKPDNRPGYWTSKDLFQNAVVPFTRDGFAIVDWRTASNIQMQIGDQVFLYKQGRSRWPTGVFGEGSVIENPTLGSDNKYRVKIKINNLRDPQLGFLLDEVESLEILGHLCDMRSSGCVIPFDIAQALTVALKTKMNIQAYENNEWSDEEMQEAVKAYFYMLSCEKDGLPYNKSEINRNLRSSALKRRSKSAVEYRMQNISYVLDKLGLDRIKGYMPAKNVGPKGEATILKILNEFSLISTDDLKPTADKDVLESRVKKIQKIGITNKPAGVKHQKFSEVTTTVYCRDPKVKAWVLQNADGSCEGCGTKAPFLTADNQPFLEVHHVRWLAHDGSDRVENAVALCPNCHRRCHFSKDMEEFKEGLYLKVLRLVRE